MSDLELEYGSDREVSENHSKLLEAVTQLDKGQRIKKPERSEPSLEVSEFHLVKSGVTDKNAVQLGDLAKALNKKGSHAKISKKLKAAQNKSKVLPKPLDKHAADKIKRIVGFKNVKRELGKWDGIVARNRTAEHISFPLKQPSMRLETTNEFVKRFRIQSDLEKELAALGPTKEEEEKEQEQKEFPMTLEEILDRRKETARFRAQQSYKEAKAYRQKKIKSKKFHRVQRKERIKQQLKDFEELQKTDPRAALEKLEQLDKTRAEERMSLRHKSTGQWAKNLQVRAKYDKESRQVLAQQLSISRELTQKVDKDGESADEEEEEGEEESAVVSNATLDRENPWVNGTKAESEIDTFLCRYRKYWDERKNSERSKVIDEKNEKDNECDNNKKHVENEIPQMNPVEEVIEEHRSEDENRSSTRGRNIDSNSEKSSDKVEQLSKKKKRMGESLKKLNTKAAGVSLKSLPCRATEKRKDSLVVKSCTGTKMKATNDSIAIGTSSWSVTSLESKDAMHKKMLPSKSLEIDDLFDVMEDKLQDRINLKLKSVRRKYKELRINNGKKLPDDQEDLEKIHIGDLDFKRRKNKPVIDERMDEIPSKGGSREKQDQKEITMLKKLTNTDINVASDQVTSEKADIDPNKFISVKAKRLKTELPDTITGGDEALDDSEGDEERHMIISEAFADDDVVDEFRKEKNNEIKKAQPEDVDLSLPGWGTWGGRSVKVTRRKKRRFIFKFPKDAPRKDKNKGDVIIIEEKDPKVKEHQVSELPFPFTAVKDFEASIRAPIGRTFVPENAHRKLIEPAVKTKIGKVIEPMDEESLINIKNTKKRRWAPAVKRGSRGNNKR